MEIQDVIKSDLNNFDTTEEKRTYLEDVTSHGCSSGVVGDLIYYHDTEAFFREHTPEINNLLSRTILEGGYISPKEFLSGFDAEDPLCLETQNRNLLAWFAYEAVALNILNNQEDFERDLK